MSIPYCVKFHQVTNPPFTLGLSFKINACKVEPLRGALNGQAMGQDRKQCESIWCMLGRGGGLLTSGLSHATISP